MHHESGLFVTELFVPYGVKVIGHGVEAYGSFYCCAHCASMAGAEGIADRA